MIKNQAAKIVLIYLTILFTFSLVFIISFWVPFFSEEKVLFYRGIFLLVLTTVIFIFLIVIFKRKITFSFEIGLSAVIVAASLNLSFFILFPVSIERSVSVYLLSTLNKADKTASCKGYSPDKLQNKLIDEYIVKNRAIAKRVEEQSQISFIEKNNSCISLTEKGKKFLNFSEIIKKLYTIK